MYIQQIPIIIWFLTIAVVIAISIPCQIPLWRARRELYQRLDFYSRVRVGMLSMRNPELIFDDSDTPEMRVLKRLYVDKIMSVRPLGRRIIWIAFAGAILSLLAGMFCHS
jgi:hypothetical protein